METNNEDTKISPRLRIEMRRSIRGLVLAYHIGDITAAAVKPYSTLVEYRANYIYIPPHTVIKITR